MGNTTLQAHAFNDIEEHQALVDIANRQQVLNDILLRLHHTDVSNTYEVALDSIGSYMGLHRIMLFEDTPGHQDGKAVYEWNNGSVPRILDSQPLHLEYAKDLPGISEVLDSEGIFLYKDNVPNIKKGVFDSRETTAVAIITVYNGDERYGILSFADNQTERTWDENTIFFLKYISNIISAAVSRMKNADMLHVSQKTMENVLNNVPNYMYVIDPADHSIVFENDASRKIFDKSSGTNLLHEEINSYCKTCEHRHHLDPKRKPHYFELHMEGLGQWLGVQCAVTTWTDGRKLRLFSAQDISEKKQHDEFIRRIAFMDHLTSLPNRYKLDADLREVLERAHETGGFSYLLFVDLDDFKIVNDGYGHDYGDALLIEFANYMMETFEDSYVFRFGGDEFVAVIDPSAAHRVNEFIDLLVERARQPWDALDKSFYCTVSIGVVRFPDGQMQVKDIIKNADIAMYEAKKKGKNSYLFYNDSMHNDSIERAEMESMMRTAISDDFNGFQVHFQPYLSATGQKITGAEALIRWYAPGGRLLMPDDFISLAEYLGLIIPLGEYVITSAANVLKCINDNYDENFTMSVNISVRQLKQQDIVGRIEDILEETGVDPKNLILEITEGMAAEEFSRVELICNELRSRGIRIAIDDFGTGYSSLGNMRNMPIDIIKIDKSFTEGACVDSYSNSFIKLITDLGHSMGKEVCVEGVETYDQYDYCKATEADSVQGFHFYRPMPSSQLYGLWTENGSRIN